MIIDRIPHIFLIPSPQTSFIKQIYSMARALIRSN